MKNVFTTDLESVSGEIYRRSQHSDYEEAKVCGAVYYTGLMDGGYSAIIDGLIGMESVANCLCHNSQDEDIRIIMTLNEYQDHEGEVLPECWLGEATDKLEEWLEVQAAIRRLAPSKQ